MEPIVKFNNVSKVYSFYKNQSEKLLEILSLGKKRKTFSALKNVTFDVFKGESIGVIGINGSGKSTLSSLLAQVLEPTTGTVNIKGDPYLIAISAGLNNNLTGLENIELKCLMLGLKKEKIKEITPGIIDFADIGEFINQPVKNYSSGMKSRLGFAISVHIDPDILIIDEALSVGDQTFYEKCLNKIKEFKEQGKTIFFISHSISQVQSFSDKVLWLHHGEVKEFGDKQDVLAKYQEFIKWFNALNENEKKEYKKSMLQEQVDQKPVNFTPTNRLIRYKKNKNKKSLLTNTFLFLQTSLLFFLLIYSIFLMLSLNETTTTAASKSNKQISHAIQESNKEITKSTSDSNQKIDSNGIVLMDKINIYSDPKLKKQRLMIPFGTQVYVINKEKDTLKIRFQNIEGYTNVQNIKIYNNDLIPVKYSIQSLLDIMPKTFSDSYLFYLSFLNKNYDTVEKSIRGLTKDYTDIFGNPVIQYNSGIILYTFDKNHIARSLTINNIDTGNNELYRLIKKSQIQNDEQKLYYIITNQNKLVINLMDKSINIQQI